MKTYCDIHNFAVSEGPNGASRAVTKCLPHGVVIDDISTAVDSNLCAVGRVEKAVVDGLAKINGVDWKKVVASLYAEAFKLQKTLPSIPASEVASNASVGAAILTLINIAASIERGIEP